MVVQFKSGDLAYYNRLSSEEVITCIILQSLYTDYEHYYKGSKPVSYFECLINNKIETICDIWLRKQISK